ncbi:MAG: hypothetical protein WC728_12520 [Elusimicrobiota bacterium]
MARNTNANPKASQDDTEVIREKPADTLLRSWGKKMSLGKAAVIPVFVGGSWTLQIPRGNKRVLTVKI